MNQIMNSQPSARAPQGTPAMSWIVPGSMNGSMGNYNLVVLPNGQVLYFHYSSR